MEVTASNRFATVSPRKVRTVLQQLPGRKIVDALNVLRFNPSPHARLVAKIVKSAASNAENNYAMDPDALYVKRAIANDARRLPRFRPAGHGRVHRYVKRTAHITIVVDERED